MAAGITRISDFVIPQVYYPYSYQLSAKTSAFVRSGIIEQLPEYDALAASPGYKVTMRYIRPPSERPRAWKADGTNATTSEKLLSSQQDVPLFNRMHKLGSNQLATRIAGAREIMTLGRASWGYEAKILPGDMSAAIAHWMADLWNEDLQATLISALNGAFASTTNVAGVTDSSAPGLSSQVLDATISSGTIGAANRVSPATLGRAAGLLSDRGNRLKTLAIHPDVYYGNLLPNNVTPNLQTSTQMWNVPSYLDYQIILDDTLPVDATAPLYPKYTSYLFAPGSVMFGDAFLDPSTGAEVSRDPDQSEEYLYTRRSYTFGIGGVSYIGSIPVSGEGPSDAQLANGANWARSDFIKNIPIVKLVTNG